MKKKGRKSGVLYSVLVLFSVSISILGLGSLSGVQGDLLTGASASPTPSHKAKQPLDNPPPTPSYSDCKPYVDAALGGTPLAQVQPPPPSQEPIEEEGESEESVPGTEAVAKTEEEDDGKGEEEHEGPSTTNQTNDDDDGVAEEDRSESSEETESHVKPTQSHDDEEEEEENESHESKGNEEDQSNEAEDVEEKAAGVKGEVEAEDESKEQEDDSKSSEEKESEEVTKEKGEEKRETKANPAVPHNSPLPPQESTESSSSSEEDEQVAPHNSEANSPDTKESEESKEDSKESDESVEIEKPAPKKKGSNPPKKVSSPKKVEEEVDEEDSDEGESSETERRPRSNLHTQLLISSPTNKPSTALTTSTLRHLKTIYETSIKPLEALYKYKDLSNRHFGDPEIFSKPMIVFMGPWSGGKSTIINWLLGIGDEADGTGLRTGADPSPAQFNILTYGNEEEVVDGTQLAADYTFSGLAKFGQAFLDRLKGKKLKNPLLEKLTLIEIPGILEIRKQVQRSFPFNDAVQWFIDRADVLFLVYDPAKLDIGPETEAILDQLKGRESHVRIVLNKADTVTPDELLRIQANLIWNISPLLSSAEPPVMYAASLWSHPFSPSAPKSLLQSHENQFLKDIAEAIDKRVETRIAGARRFGVRVRNHAKMVDCYLATYNNHRSFWSNKRRVVEDILQNPQNYHIYEGLSTLTNISRYDLPHPQAYSDFFHLNPVWEFPTLASTCTFFRGCPLTKLDMAIAYELPELLGRWRRGKEAEGISEEMLAKEPGTGGPAAPPMTTTKTATGGRARWYKDGVIDVIEKPSVPEPEPKVEPKKRNKWWKDIGEEELKVEEPKEKKVRTVESRAKVPPPAPAKPAEAQAQGKNKWWKPYTEPPKPSPSPEEKKAEGSDKPKLTGKARWWKEQP